MLETKTVTNGSSSSEREQPCHDTLPWLISFSLGIVDHLQRRFARFTLSLL